MSSRNAPSKPGLRLVPCRDADFAWMLGEAAGRDGFRLPPGGVDAPEGVRLVRSIHRAAGGDADPATWLMIVDDEVVGLCGRSRPGGPGGDAEIGLGRRAALLLRPDVTFGPDGNQLYTTTVGLEVGFG